MKSLHLPVPGCVGKRTRGQIHRQKLVALLKSIVPSLSQLHHLCQVEGGHDILQHLRLIRGLVRVYACKSLFLTICVHARELGIFPYAPAHAEDES